MVPLDVVGEGKCLVENFGGCWPVLLLSHVSGDSFASWKPSDADVVFETAPTSFYENKITGPLVNGPTEIAVGRWSIGVGLAERSDVRSVPDWGYVVCLNDLDVLPTTSSVQITANISDTKCLKFNVELGRGLPAATDN